MLLIYQVLSRQVMSMPPPEGSNMSSSAVPNPAFFEGLVSRPNELGD